MATPHRRVAGIDVHKSSISVCILPPQHKPEGMVRHEKFSTFLRPLRKLRRLLTQCQVTEVVMESTGQYWRPVWNALEGLELITIPGVDEVGKLRGKRQELALALECTLTEHQRWARIIGNPARIVRAFHR